MPKPTSKAQFRLLQAVKHGRSTKATSLSAEEASKGLSEFHGNYQDLPARKGPPAKKGKGRSKRKGRSRPVRDLAPRSGGGRMTMAHG